MKRNGRLAFTVLELLFVIAIIVMVVGVLVPKLIEGKRQSQRNDCMHNLKQIGLSVRMWSPDSNNVYPMQRSTNEGGTKEHIDEGNAFRNFVCLSNELQAPHVLVCPSDRRVVASGFQNLSNENVSYFLGVDAQEDEPQGILNGDRNVLLNGSEVKPGLVAISSNSAISWSGTMHRRKGNVGLADGSVLWMDDAGLQKLVKGMRPKTNRLAMP